MNEQIYTQHYKIVEHIVTLSGSDKRQVALNLISWNGQVPKWDLRLWHFSYPEGFMPGKGLVLSDQEIEILFDALKKCFDQAAPKAHLYDEAMFDAQHAAPEHEELQAQPSEDPGEV